MDSGTMLLHRLMSGCAGLEVRLTQRRDCPPRCSDLSSVRRHYFVLLRLASSLTMFTTPVKSVRQAQQPWSFDPREYLFQLAMFATGCVCSAAGLGLGYLLWAEPS